MLLPFAEDSAAVETQFFRAKTADSPYQVIKAVVIGISKFKEIGEIAGFVLNPDIVVCQLIIENESHSDLIAQ